MDYKIKDKTEIPERIPKRPGGKWVDLFDPLPMNKVVELTFADKLEARYQQTVITNSIRNLKRDYKLKTRVIHNENSVSVYVWKVKNEQ